jgi:hypothetical protein
MKLLVVHDGKGQILFLGKPTADSRAGFSTGIKPKAGQHLFEITLPPHFHEKSLGEIQDLYEVDVASKSLTPKSPK